jgi:hypothetical protein
MKIIGKTFEPDWGLYNGSMGKVIKYVNDEDQNPNCCSFPQYIKLEFPQYCGPPWIKEHPNQVLIPASTIMPKTYCQVTCILLDFA